MATLTGRHQRKQEGNKLNVTTDSHQKDLLQLSSTLSKMLKRTFGKGPEACFVTNQSSRLTVYIKNFTTPSEVVMIESNQVSLAYSFRNAVVAKVINDFRLEAEDVLGVSFTLNHSDWDYGNNTGLIIFENSDNELGKMMRNETLRTKLSDAINYVGSNVNKAPDHLEVTRLNQNIYAVDCEGMMLQIEKVLYEKEYYDLLHEHSRGIKESFIKRKSVFEEVFDREVLGLFMTWDYKYDRNSIYFYLQ
ncbi:Na-translocating system protein MpsC family protein [Evansella sp. AB-rgal1]|uniref:Na-translocating system protein MpsC family protein n=1 Tax=Evansella sp. AB-rgal1 TaxID=3242696 RepID=UPI00359D2C22